MNFIVPIWVHFILPIWVYFIVPIWAFFIVPIWVYFIVPIWVILNTYVNLKWYKWCKKDLQEEFLLAKFGRSWFNYQIVKKEISLFFLDKIKLFYIYFSYWICLSIFRSRFSIFFFFIIIVLFLILLRVTLLLIDLSEQLNFM